jgi:hypothetical protein
MLLLLGIRLAVPPHDAWEMPREHAALREPS